MQEEKELPVSSLLQYDALKKRLRETAYGNKKPKVLRAALPTPCQPPA